MQSRQHKAGHPRYQAQVYYYTSLGEQDNRRLHREVSGSCKDKVTRQAGAGIELRTCRFWDEPEKLWKTLG